jgi:hypothetical protein
MAARIPGATVHEADCGHPGCVLASAAFVPAFVQAVNTTRSRIVDRHPPRDRTVGRLS